MPLTRITGDNVNGDNFSVGITSVRSLSIGSTQIVSSARQLQNITSLDATTTATIESAISNAPNTFNDLQVTGISTFVNGPVLVGSGTSTGTVSQQLQVTGGAYVSGNTGIGTTNPTTRLDVFVTGGEGLPSVVTGERMRVISNDISGRSTYSTIIAGTSAYSGIFFGDKDSADIGRIRYYHLTNSLEFHTNNTQRVTIDANGIVLVGSATSTGTASQQLQVTGGGYFSQFVGIGATTRTYSSSELLEVKNGFAAFVNPSATVAPIYAYNTDTTASTNQPYITLSDGSGNRGGIGVNYTDTALWIHGQNGIRFRGSGTSSGSAEWARFDSSGNLGIGTISPQSSLDVYVDQNTSTILYVRNPNSGSSARTRIVASSDSGAGNISIGQHSSNYAGASNQGWVWTSGTSTPLVLGTVGTERVRITPTGSVGIATANPQYTLHVNGSFAATTKSFVIPHPTKLNYKLRYASLEGEENGVYLRGRTQESIIELPEYWTNLIDENSITVNLTPIGNKTVWVEEINNNKVYINSEDTIDCFYTVFAERKDVEKLVVEVEEN
jgi:hypothetical protein